MNASRMIYIVTAVDHGAACSGKAIVIDVLNTEMLASAVAKNDMLRWAERNNADVNFDLMSAVSRDDPDYRCEWRVHEQTICW